MFAVGSFDVVGQVAVVCGVYVLGVVVVGGVGIVVSVVCVDVALLLQT